MGGAEGMGGASLPGPGFGAGGTGGAGVYLAGGPAGPRAGARRRRERAEPWICS